MNKTILLAAEEITAGNLLRVAVRLGWDAEALQGPTGAISS